MSQALKSPFPYFGGKSSASDIVWDRFGDVPSYVEPFFGSGAVLLRRPTPPGIETVNDIDAYLANFWRAVRAEPDAVAELMDWPVNEKDLEARHKWLVTAARKREHAERMRDDPDYYDVRIAAYWCWGLSAWIGGGWCSGVWNGRGSNDNTGSGINVQDEQRGGKMPQLIHHGQGVHARRPHLADSGRGVHRTGVSPLSAWMQALSHRLRRVRVCCGDFERALGPSVTVANGLTGVFLDPPYSAEAGRDENIYAEEDLTVAHRAREWAIAHGDDARYRIALCGYEGEHEIPPTWECVHWKTAGGYANIHADQGTRGKANKHRERIWFSPHCLKPGLF